VLYWLQYACLGTWQPYDELCFGVSLAGIVLVANLVVFKLVANRIRASADHPSYGPNTVAIGCMFLNILAFVLGEMSVVFSSSQSTETKHINHEHWEKRPTSKPHYSI
jgi:hypothetical protein